MYIEENIESIIQNYGNMVYRLAFAKTGNKDDADDIFQEVFLRYVRKNPNFEQEEHRKAWLLRVTINCSNSFFTSFWHSKTQELDENIKDEQEENLDLYNELQKLPKKYREVIHLFYYEDLTSAQIADILHRKESTVRMQLTRGRQILKSFMKEEDYV